MKKPKPIIVSRLLTFAFFSILVLTLASSKQVFAASIPQEYGLLNNQFQDTESLFLDFDFITNHPFKNMEINLLDSSPPHFSVSTTKLAEEVDWYIYLPLVLNPIAPFDCPQAGNWSGTTSQGKEIVFAVEDTPSCQISYGSLSVRFTDSCAHTLTVSILSEFSIIDNHFDTGMPSFLVIGDFTSPTAAEGTFYHSMPEYGYPGFYCTVSGTWTANYLP